MGITHLLYLHGFRSSPQSMKAMKVAAWMREHRPDVHWWCPQLPPSPREAMAMVAERIDAWPRDTMAVIGSSLGGFYATIVAERMGCKAVLVNPAVKPARDLAKYIGEITAWHGDDTFFFREEFVEELQVLRPSRVTQPGRYWAYVAKGDEVLDWREMQARYAQCHMTLLEGGDHALSDFDDHWPAMARFLGLTSG
ncbi:YqiA/YcfP family alpha/beta fold hydrolase [Piscinibacter terrae]|uniref:Esterase n=1 Tax=Piscinibacter terrae TaxID=2496871 RepID=A0A3N7JR77_9BURK|nr:YqiA/YcfP family alpha/beta fold hydrolase [Albitalea terrae]RQP21545.1 esterase [Albitalea terrae]